MRYFSSLYPSCLTLLCSIYDLPSLSLMKNIGVAVIPSLLIASDLSFMMGINWQAKDSEGNSIDCSMTVKLDSGGIQSVIGEPKFGGITSSEEVLKLVGQNKEVFINGKTLYQAFTGISKSVDDQQVPAEEIFTKDLHISPQSPTPSSSGYSSPSTPSSRRSSISTSSEFSDEDEIFEDDMSGDEEEYEQEGLKDEVDEIINEIEELKEGKETFAQHLQRRQSSLRI
ncbi:conserved hypothetical protein [Wolbachia endosymbiont of Drosophila ananassae]|nr:conserved hypothetical protein [Wolbachia endosymbiont of Drosophila ananassae]